jgi:hypothetical protein
VETTKHRFELFPLKGQIERGDAERLEALTPDRLASVVLGRYGWMVVVEAVKK